jgi:hypothetical protein
MLVDVHVMGWQATDGKGRGKAALLRGIANDDVQCYPQRGKENRKS